MEILQFSYNLGEEKAIKSHQSRKVHLYLQTKSMKIFRFLLRKCCKFSKPTLNFRYFFVIQSIFLHNLFLNVFKLFLSYSPSVSLPPLERKIFKFFIPAEIVALRKSLMVERNMTLFVRVPANTIFVYLTNFICVCRNEIILLGKMHTPLLQTHN